MFSATLACMCNSVSCVWRPPGFARLSFWYKQHVDEDECEALVEYYWQGDAGVPGHTPSSTLFTTNLTRTGQGLHQGLQDEKPSTNLQLLRIQIWSACDSLRTQGTSILSTKQWKLRKEVTFCVETVNRTHDHNAWEKYGPTVTHRIPTFRLTTDRIHDGGPIRL